VDSVTLMITLFSIAVPVIILVVVGFTLVRVFRPILQGQATTRQLLQTGVPAQATILTLADTGTTINGNPMADLLLDVRPADRPPFQARTRTIISRLRISMLQPGAVVPVRYDPNDLSKIAIDLA